MATSSGRLTLSYSARAGRFGLPVDKIPEIPLELVRSVEITENFHRCKKNLVNFCRVRKASTTEGRGTQREEGHRGKRDTEGRGHRGTQRNYLHSGYRGTTCSSRRHLPFV